MATVTAQFISDPVESYKDLLAWDELYKTLPKVFWFNDTLAKHVTEILPGEMVGVEGRTGNGKTAFLVAQGLHQSKQLIAQKKDLENFVCYFTWDQPKEKLEARVRRAMEAELSKYGITARAELPLWFVGKGLMDARENEYQRTPLTVEIVEDTLEKIMAGKKKPSLLLVDYLQRIPSKNDLDKTNQVMRVCNALSDFAARYNVPVLVGTQASRETDKQLDKTPTLGGSRWSAEFEDMVDKLIALWRPATTEKRGTFIDVDGKPFAVDDLLMKCIKWKDREGASNKAFAFPFDMATLKTGNFPDATV